MVDAVVGAVIMVVATTSLVAAIEVVETAFTQAGRYPLNRDEITILDRAGVDVDQRDVFWRENVLNAPREVLQRD